VTPDLNSTGSAGGISCWSDIHDGNNLVVAMQLNIGSQETKELANARRARREPQTHAIVKHHKDPAAVSAHGRKLIADLKDLTEGRPEVMTLVWVSGKHP
jgi:hypothetical protein